MQNPQPIDLLAYAPRSAGLPNRRLSDIQAYALACTDVVILVVALLAGNYGTFGHFDLLAANQRNLFVVATFSVTFLAGVLGFLLVQRRRRQLSLIPALITVTTAIGVTIVFAFFFRSYYSRSFLLTVWSAGAIGVVVNRLVFRRLAPPWVLAYRVGNRLAGVLEQVQGLSLLPIERPAELTPTEIDALVVDYHIPLDKEWARFVTHCSILGIPVIPTSTVVESMLGKIPTEYISDGWVVDLFGATSNSYIVFKQALERLLILLAAPILIPIMLLTWLAIRLESSGAAIFTQQRTGKDGKPFKMYKFRSMTVRAPDAAASFADADEHRITRVGKLIRKVRIDELPQLVNVLMGQMHLIGPRPEQVSFAKQYEEKILYYAYRHRVKPGITGWAQVQHGYTASDDETMDKLRYDLYYVKHLSFRLDLIILWRTVLTVLTGFGAK